MFMRTTPTELGFTSDGLMAHFLSTSDFVVSGVMHSYSAVADVEPTLEHLDIGIYMELDGGGKGGIGGIGGTGGIGQERKSPPPGHPSVKGHMGSNGARSEMYNFEMVSSNKADNGSVLSSSCVPVEQKG